VRLATAIAGGLAVAAVAMGVLAFTTGDESTPGAAMASSGLAVWTAQGCGSCHTLAAANAHAELGPDLEASLAGRSAAYVKRSIVAPNAEAAPGYTVGSMPDDFGSRIAPADLDRLVSFLRASAR
jgi:cytochrome c553